MKKGIVTILAMIISIASFSQEFGNLKFKLPSKFSKHVEANLTTYQGISASKNNVRFIFHEVAEPAPKPDSSYRQQWQTIMATATNNAPIPSPKKKTTIEGIKYLENGAKTVVDGEEEFSQLLVFILDDSIQAVQIVVKDQKTYKAESVELISEFLDSIRLLKKKK
ncbi:hypothetical protein [Polluticaenibacter yanchengensis]|uniref:DUF4252 domain-containing protein n=1 Tax=Polluticaenibacter yanchengensis TaxID=3014562 RepID=A0ABT4UJ32_9BACT|nr:hypothetical protein [Chitinophagaceae bacterium LY-5]